MNNKEVIAGINNKTISLEDILRNFSCVQKDIVYKFTKYSEYFLNDELINKLIYYSLFYLDYDKNNETNLAYYATEFLSKAKHVKLLDKLFENKDDKGCLFLEKIFSYLNTANFNDNDNKDTDECINELFSGYFFKIIVNLINKSRIKILEYILIKNKNVLQLLLKTRENIHIQKLLIYIMFAKVENIEDLDDDELLQWKDINEKQQELLTYCINSMYNSLSNTVDSLYIQIVNSFLCDRRAFNTCITYNTKILTILMTKLNEIFSYCLSNTINNTNINNNNNQNCLPLALSLLSNLSKNIILDFKPIKGFEGIREIIINPDDVYYSDELDQDEEIEEEKNLENFRNHYTLSDNAELYNKSFDLLLAICNNLMLIFVTKINVKNRILGSTNLLTIENINLILHLITIVNEKHSDNNMENETFKIFFNDQVLEKVCFDYFDCLIKAFIHYENNSLLHKEFEICTFFCVHENTNAWLSKLLIEKCNFIEIIIKIDLYSPVYKKHMVNISEVCTMIFMSDNITVKNIVEGNSKFCRFYKYFFSPLITKLKEKLDIEDNKSEEEISPIVNVKSKTSGILDLEKEIKENNKEKEISLNNNNTNTNTNISNIILDSIKTVDNNIMNIDSDNNDISNKGIIKNNSPLKTNKNILDSLSKTNDVELNKKKSNNHSRTVKISFTNTNHQETTSSYISILDTTTKKLNISQLVEKCINDINTINEEKMNLNFLRRNTESLIRLTSSVLSKTKSINKMVDELSQLDESSVDEENHHSPDVHSKNILRDLKKNSNDMNKKNLTISSFKINNDEETLHINDGRKKHSVILRSDNKEHEALLNNLNNNLKNSEYFDNKKEKD